MLSKVNYLIVGFFFLTVIAAQMTEHPQLPYVIAALLCINFMMLILNQVQAVRRSGESVWVVNMALNLGVIVFVAICVYMARVRYIDPMFFITAITSS